MTLILAIFLRDLSVAVKHVLGSVIAKKCSLLVMVVMLK